MKKFIWNNAGKLTLLWALIIFILCATPGSYIPSASWLEMLSFDKWIHAGVFFILSSFLILFHLKNKQTNSILLLYVTMSILYGGLLEIMQAKVFSERSADWQDFIANSFGCLISLLFYKRLKKMFYFQS